MTEGGHTLLIELLPGYHNLEVAAAMLMGKPYVGDQPPSPTHVLLAAVVVVLVVAAVLKAGFHKGRPEDHLVPDKGFTIKGLLEAAIEGLLLSIEEIVGTDTPGRFLPLIGTLAVFILLSNLMGLVPGFAPPTSSLNTTLACGVVVFVATHYYGFKTHGWKYYEHFLGPIWWMIPLMAPLEIVSHLVRPVSLALRLFGNMVGDHMLLAMAIGAFPLLVPLPAMVMGLVVSILQTMVFCLLAMVYIRLAISPHKEEA